MKIVVFDTETTSINKPFCYNIGYLIIDTDDWKTTIKRSYVVEQIWHNLPLFSTAYYADKRQIYIEEMRAKRTIMNKFGYICQQMIRDFNIYQVEKAFAYNSPFDEKVFNFNCDWFKCNNPFDNVPIIDIRGFVHQFLINKKYKNFCDKYNLYTESGNYSTTAEDVYRYVIDNPGFNEEHTALDDSIIESEILRVCTQDFGADLNRKYEVKRSIEREQERTLHIRTIEQTDYYFDYRKIRMNKEKTEIILR